MAVTWTRQIPAPLDRKLNLLAQQRTAPAKRIILDTRGIHSTSVASRSDLERFSLYAQRRHESVARTLALFELLRDREQLYAQRTLTVDHSGAVWQAFRGTHGAPACHTCPSHLNINSHLPTMATTSLPLRRHLIHEFADCMLMPVSVNAIDSIIDAEVGRELFADTAQMVLRERGATWQQGVDLFREGMRDHLPGAAEAFMSATPSGFVATDSTEQQQLDMAQAYYEGLFLHSSSSFGVTNFKAQVDREVQAAP